MIILLVESALTLPFTQHGSETGPVNIVYTVTLGQVNNTPGNIGFTLSNTGGQAIAGSDYILFANNSIAVAPWINFGNIHCSSD
jgi:hypothetical protein